MSETRGRDWRPGQQTECNRCGEPFVPSAASARKGMWRCAPCRREDTRKRYVNRKALGLRVRGVTMPYSERRDQLQEYYRRPDVMAQRAALYKQRRESSPRVRMQERVRGMVRSAIESGELERGRCEVCGKGGTDAHHDDYDKPLDVRWLCRKHHCELHAAAARGEPAKGETS